MKFLYLTFICLMTTFVSVQDKPTKLIYFGDPMCSWCYGFAPEITKIQEAYPDLELEIVLGGLRPNGTETMAELNDFLKHHWEDVGKASGQKFSYEILEDETFVYNTEPASRAVIVARTINPDIELAFFKAIQTAFYADNKNTTELATFLEIAETFDLDKEEFERLYNSPEIINETKADVQLANRMSIRGFPSLVLQDADGYTLISKGYMKAEYINELLKENL